MTLHDLHAHVMDLSPKGMLTDAECALTGALLARAARADRSAAASKIARAIADSLSHDAKLKIAGAAHAAASDCRETVGWLEEHAGMPKRSAPHLTLTDAHTIIAKLRSR